MEDAIELCMLTSGHDCKAPWVIGVLIPEFRIAVARLPIHIPSTFILTNIHVHKRVGMCGDGSQGFLISQT